MIRLWFLKAQKKFKSSQPKIALAEEIKNRRSLLQNFVPNAIIDLDEKNQSRDDNYGYTIQTCAIQELENGKSLIF